IVLASQSQRRIDLLKQFGLDFKVCAADIAEAACGSPEKTAVNNAVLKAKAVLAQYPECLVIGADTVVVARNQILGKPRDRDEAFAMLRMLSGAKHQVLTGVALLTADREKCFYVATDVWIRELAAYEIRTYIDTGEPFDKAGGYAIQGIGGAFVESISGCYYNVVGLPMPRLLVELRGFGIDVFARGSCKEE
ncbi:MAG: Maf family protein, partial [Limnochordia bacterium]